MKRVRKAKEFVRGVLLILLFNYTLRGLPVRVISYPSLDYGVYKRDHLG